MGTRITEEPASGWDSSRDGRWALAWKDVVASAVGRGTASAPVAHRPQQEPHVEEDLQQITVQVEPACGVEMAVPKEEDAR